MFGIVRGSQYGGPSKRSFQCLESSLTGRSPGDKHRQLLLSQISQGFGHGTVLWDKLPIVPCGAQKCHDLFLGFWNRPLNYGFYLGWLWFEVPSTHPVP
ncbi:hypothetical protein FKM82_023823 [Ascaphus truei]